MTHLSVFSRRKARIQAKTCTWTFTEAPFVRNLATSQKFIPRWVNSHVTTQRALRGRGMGPASSTKDMKHLEASRSITRNERSQVEEERSLCCGIPLEWHRHGCTYRPHRHGTYRAGKGVAKRSEEAFEGQDTATLLTASWLHTFVKM